MTHRRFRLSAIPGALLAVFLGGCGGIVIVNRTLPYDQVCTSERPECRADGDSAVIMPRRRPPFEGRPETYLGSLVNGDDVCTTRKLSCPHSRRLLYHRATRARKIAALDEEMIGQVSAAI